MSKYSSACAAILCLIGCNALPTSPDYNGPEIIFHDATAEQEASGQELWTEIKECVGYGGERSKGFPVYVVSEPILCAGVWTAGCYKSGDRIIVHISCSFSIVGS